MQKFIPIVLSFGLLTVGMSSMTAQVGVGQEPKKQVRSDDSASSIIEVMMGFNKKKDGRLTKEELTDARLHRLFDYADADKDGVVTVDELKSAAAKLDAEWGPGGGGKKDGKGFGKDGGPKGGPPKGQKGFGGKGPKGGFDNKGGPPGGGFQGGPPSAPRAGQILPGFLEDELNLSADQKRQLERLQRDVDESLAKILNEDQRRKLTDLGDRGPGSKGPKGKGPPPN